MGRHYDPAKFYFTGKPCPHGHIAERSIGLGYCRTCDILRGRKRWASKPGKLRKKAITKEEKNARNRVRYHAAYHADPSYHKERTRKWKLKNPEKCAAFLRNWGIKNKERKRAILAAYRARKRNAMPTWVNSSVLFEIYKNCPDGLHVDHIVPLKGIRPDGGGVCGLHVPWNLRYLPRAQNIGRLNRLKEDDLHILESLEIGGRNGGFSY